MSNISLYAEEARRIYYGGDPPAEAGWRLAEAEILAAQALSMIAKEEFWIAAEKDNAHMASSQYKVNYPIDLQVESARGVKYALLPSGGYLSLPSDKGVDSVAYDDDTCPITYTTTSEWKRMQNGTAIGAISTYYYMIEAGKIIIRGDCKNARIPFSRIYVTLAVANADTIQQAQGWAVVAKMLQLYTSVKQHPDNVPDNARPIAEQPV